MRVWALASASGVVALAAACSSQTASEPNVSTPDAEAKQNDTQVDRRERQTTISRNNSQPEAPDQTAKELLQARLSRRADKDSSKAPKTAPGRQARVNASRVSSNREQIQQRIQALTARAQANQSRLPVTTAIPRSVPRPATVVTRSEAVSPQPSAAQAPSQPEPSTTAATTRTAPIEELALGGDSTVDRAAPSGRPLPASEPLHQSDPIPSSESLSAEERAHITEAQYRARVAQILSSSRARALHGSQAEAVETPPEPLASTAEGNDTASPETVERQSEQPASAPEVSLEVAPAVAPESAPAVAPETAPEVVPEVSAEISQVPADSSRRFAPQSATEQLSRPLFSPSRAEPSPQEMQLHSQAEQSSSPTLFLAGSGQAVDSTQFEFSPEADAIDAVTLRSQCSTDFRENKPTSSAAVPSSQSEQVAQAEVSDAEGALKVLSKSLICWEETSVLAQSRPEAATAGTPIPGRVESPTR